MNVEIIFDGEYYPIRAKVYAIDNVRDRFLVVDDDGYFEWVETHGCKIVDSETEDSFEPHR